jgi:hypothetical protein
MSPIFTNLYTKTFESPPSISYLQAAAQISTPVHIELLPRSIVMQMENNDWTVNSDDLYDLNCSAQGKVVELKSKDRLTEFYMRFDEFSPDEFQRRLCPPFDEDRSDGENAKTKGERKR